MWDYNKKVMDHFLHPQNVGEIPDADAVGEVGNIRCGDALKLFIKLDAKKEKIAEAKFKTFGCASAIASSSALTELIKGMTLAEAGKVTNKDIVKLLGELPEEKLHCSVMGMEALQAAIANYNGETAVVHDDDHDGVVICKCFGVTDTKIRAVAKENKLRKAEEITNYTKAGGGCGCCLDDIQQILDELWRTNTAKMEKPLPQKLTVVQKVMKVQEVIDKEIKPMLETDGGSIELVDIQGDNVLVRLCGRCASCPASGVTLKHTVEDKLREFVSPELTVEEVK